MTTSDLGERVAQAFLLAVGLLIVAYLVLYVVEMMYDH